MRICPTTLMESATEMPWAVVTGDAGEKGRAAVRLSRTLRAMVEQSTQSEAQHTPPAMEVPVAAAEVPHMAAGSVPEVEAERHEEGLGVMAEVWAATAEEERHEEGDELLAGNGLGRDSSITPSGHGVSGGCRPAHPSPLLVEEPNVSEG